MAGTGVVLDGAVEAGEDGSYPVTNPVRPAEVVLEAPAASTRSSTGRWPPRGGARRRPGRRCPSTSGWPS